MLNLILPSKKVLSKPKFQWLKWGTVSLISLLFPLFFVSAHSSEISKWSFVDGNTANGINKDKTKSVDHPQSTVFNKKLYAIWTESYNTVNQIRVATYNNSDTNPVWSFVDGKAASGINRDITKNAGKPQLTVFDKKLYAVWKEDNGTAYQIRVVVYNSNDTNPVWTFVDGGTVNGINKDNTKNADAPQLSVFNGKLYAVWKEDNDTIGQVRAAVYNSNDTSPVWTFIDGNTANGINKDSTQNIYAPQLTVFNSKLYAIWKEENGTAGQIRVVVYNSNDVSSAWAFVDGNSSNNGINWDSTKNAYYPQLTVFNAKLYAIWRENNGITDQIRVAVYNNNDAGPAWTFVDGNTASGINKNPANFSDTPQLTVFNKKLYAIWVEKNNKAEQVRVAVYNSNDASPIWSFVDSNTINGINKNSTKAADSPQLTVFKGKLYAVWSEMNNRAWQVRVAVGQYPDEWACGSLHNHVMISEFKSAAQRTKSLKEAIAASEELGFKFIALTEKGAIYDKGTAGTGWKEMIRQCNKANKKDFTCFFGQEITTPENAKEPKGHFAIIGNKKYIPNLSIQEIFNASHQQNALAIITHPFYKKDESPLYYYDRWDIKTWDAMEIINGVVDNAANKKALAKLYELWNKNIKKSGVASADLKTIYGQNKSPEILDRKEIKKQLQKGYTCVYLNKLNRKNIKTAIKKGRSYASSGPRINKFAINNIGMGKTISIRKNKLLKIEIDLKAPTKIKKVAVIKDGAVFRKFEPKKKEFIKNFSTRARKSGWYSLEVYSENGQAFTNAIWVRTK